MGQDASTCLWLMNSSILDGYLLNFLKVKQPKLGTQMASHSNSRRRLRRVSLGHVSNPEDLTPPRGDIASESLTRRTAHNVLADFLSTRRAATLRAYAGDLRDFANRAGFATSADAVYHLLDSGAGTANRAVLAYRESLLREELAPATINRRLSALRAIVDYANMAGIIPWQLRVQRLRARPFKDTSGPGRDGFMCLLAQAAQLPNARKGARDAAILWLLFSPPLRAAEVSGILMDDLDLAKRRVAIVGKGRLEREWVTLPMQTLSAVTVWLEYRGHGPGPLFFRLDHDSQGKPLTTRGIYKLVAQLGKRCGIKVHPHALRHGGITLALDLNLPARSVQRFARHADLSTLQFYDDNRTDLGGSVASAVADAITAKT